MQRIGPEAYTNSRLWAGRLAQTGWWHSFELPGGRVIQGNNTLESLKTRIGLFPIPQDLRGKRVLDIGAWDGWFSFEMERRGAEVVAVDCDESKNFLYLHRELKSRIDYRVMDMYELSPDKLGTFDIVLFLGVLYHLKHPLLALEKVCALTRELACVQTFVSTEPGSPVMEFFEIDELGGQFDNWCAPNVSCVAAMARTAGFARVDILDTNTGKFSGATFACYRHFPEPAHTSEPAPVLAACVHAKDFGLNFRSDRDDYANAWFSADDNTLTRNDVQISIGPFHIGPVSVVSKGSSPQGNAWQATFKIPPGLPAGWNDVRVRLPRSEWSNPAKVALDLPLQVDSLRIAGAADGNTWTPSRIQAGPQAILSLWVEGLPENRDFANTRIRLGDLPLEAESIAPWEPGKAAQINVRLPEDLPPGDYALRVTVGQAASAPSSITVTPAA